MALRAGGVLGVGRTEALQTIVGETTDEQIEDIERILDDANVLLHHIYHHFAYRIGSLVEEADHG